MIQTLEGPQPGQKLRNGAICIAYNPTTHCVLTVWYGHDHPYVTWKMNPRDGSTFWGNYFKDIGRAVECFEERT